MARLHIDTSRTSSGRRDSSAQELSLLLEAQLLEVIECEGMVTSSSTLQETRLSKRARRGIRRRITQSSQQRTQTKLVTPFVPKSYIHPVDLLDQGLVRRASAPAIQPPIPSKRSTIVPVRFSPHVSSDHVVSVERPARRLVLLPRDPFGQTIRHWMAPYQVPPSVDGLVSATQDLWIEEVDPRLFLEQFTPGHAHIAYAQSYHIWSKIIAPFVRWEEVPVIRKSTKPTCAEEPLSRSSEIIFYTEQFTASDPDQAYKASYGLFGRLKRWCVNLLGVFDRGAKEAKEEVIAAAVAVEEEAEVLVEEIHEVEQEWGVPILVPRLHVFRVMTGFIGLLLVVTLPAGAVSLSRSLGSSVHDVKTQSQAALHEVESALAGSTDEQSLAWSAASVRFGRARESLMQTNVLAFGLAQTLPQTRRQYASVQALLAAGEKTSQAATLLTRGLGRALDDHATIYPDERIGIFMTYLDYATPLLEEALTLLDHVNPGALPGTVQGQFIHLREMIGDGRTSLTEARALLAFVRDALGHEGPRTYLFVFQNQTELRPTGGFMGSVAEVTFDRGRIQNMYVPGGGPYDLRDQVRTRVAAPKPLQLVGGRWEFQNANWFPDFPASAEKIRWFWSQAGQPTLDGVVTVNASILKTLLQLTGPIEMPEYGKTLTADTVMDALQKSVELEYDKKENKPKKIIGDLLPKVLERLKGGSREEWLHLLDVGLRSLETKEVQVWMSREEEEQLVERQDWNGRLKPTTGDALAIVEANIAGQKTDGSIQEKVDHHVEVARDGSMIDTVTLTRTHLAPKGELFHGANNVSYVRVYVPLGSELLTADGFEVPSSTLFEVPLVEDLPDGDEARYVQHVSSPVAQVDVTNEFGRTAFGGWIQLRPQETRTTMFQYKLPFTVFDLAARAGERTSTHTDPVRGRAAYMLLLTSQSGKTDREIHTHVSFPLDWDVSWTNQPTTTHSGLGFEGVWEEDRVLAGLLEIKE